MPRQGPIIRRIYRYSCYLISVFSLLLILLAASAGIPDYLSTSHEETYFAELDRVQKLERDWTDYAYTNKTENARWRELFSTPPEIPYNKRLLPLIHDITQLRSTTWLNQLGLYQNLTAPYPFQKTWVYIGGTPRSPEPLWNRILRRLAITSLPGPSCIDPPYICNSFNNAFNNLIEYYHTHRHHPYVEFGSNLAFVDCDNSPPICDFVQMDPPVLLYLETQGGCETHLPSFNQICGTKWKFIPLPLQKMPFSYSKRRQILPSGRKVPIFPSAFEQLHSMLSFAETADMLDLDEESVWTIEVERAVISDGPFLTIDDLGLH
ncbi:hypothetical protein Vi05172_g1256 [Venturia inaequalis]|nr:hypothetical protein Vi05172_g1256 [Venturia inaequalis]